MGEVTKGGYRSDSDSEPTGRTARPRGFEELPESSKSKSPSAKNVEFWAISNTVLINPTTPGTSDLLADWNAWRLDYANNERVQIHHIGFEWANTTDGYVIHIFYSKS